MPLENLVEALAGIEGVCGLGLGGSRSRGLANATSDYDLVLYREGGDPIAAAAIGKALSPLAEQIIYPKRGNFIQAEVAGDKMEVFQTDLSLVSREVDMAIQGKFRWFVRPLFPHGDLSTRQLTHLVTNFILQEHGGVVSALKARALPFPKPLKNSLLRFFLEQASYSVIHAGKVRSSGDLHYLMSQVSAFIYSVNIVIFAINDSYPTIEKGGERLLLGLPKLPAGYAELSRVLFSSVLANDMLALTSRMKSVLGELEQMASNALSESTGASRTGQEARSLSVPGRSAPPYPKSA